ncbi:MAG: type II toxin-antitoxin system VapC family toxin [Actinomycetota bacterium]
MIVVDTNVVSELMRAEPERSVVAWVKRQDPFNLRISAVTVAEVLYGIERLADGQRKNTLRFAAEGLFAQFADEVLPFDAEAAAIYAEIVNHRDRQGMPMSGFDAQIAAICRVHDAALSTRNERDFSDVGVELINPWVAK